MGGAVIPIGRIVGPPSAAAWIACLNRFLEAVCGTYPAAPSLRALAMKDGRSTAHRSTTAGLAVQPPASRSVRSRPCGILLQHHVGHDDVGTLGERQRDPFVEVMCDPDHIEPGAREGESLACLHKGIIFDNEHPDGRRLRDDRVRHGPHVSRAEESVAGPQTDHLERILDTISPVA